MNYVFTARTLYNGYNFIEYKDNSCIFDSIIIFSKIYFCDMSVLHFIIKVFRSIELPGGTKTHGLF